MGEKSKSGSGINILDHISKSFEQFFGFKFFNTDADPGIILNLDPGSGMEKN
jgi:hypothetical protein